MTPLRGKAIVSKPSVSSMVLHSKRAREMGTTIFPWL